MNKFKKAMILLASSVLLASTVPATLKAEEDLKTYPETVQNEGEAIKGGTLKVALGGDSFAGVLNSLYYMTGPDYNLIRYMNPGLYGSDENSVIDESGFAKVDIDYDNKQVTITIPQDQKWDDGEPITIDDVMLPYYIVGHPDYTGPRYGENVELVEGMADYHAGKTEEISGLERVDDHTLTIHYTGLNPSVNIESSIILNYMEPSHLLKDIPVAELEDNEYVRQHPVGFGPFKFDSMVPGESVTYVANPYYYKGQPKVDKLVVQTVGSDKIVAEMKAGHFDIAALPTKAFDEYKDADNFDLLGSMSNIYSFIGFKMGTWDDEKNEVNYDPDRIVSNKAIRQAMAYALDFESISKEFYDGLRKPANSHIPPVYTDVYNPDQEGYHYDPEKAKEILAEAGFKDVDGDGLVEDLNGQPMTIHFAGLAGGDNAETLVQYYLQSWREIGLNVELVDGKLLEFNSYNERVESDDPAIDVFEGTWGLLADADQSFIYARNSIMNDYRWATDEHDAILDRIHSEETLDPEFHKQAYLDWQTYMIEEIPTIPTLYSYTLTAVNKRVSEYGVGNDYDIPWEKIELLADEPIVNE